MGGERAWAIAIALTVAAGCTSRTDVGGDAGTAGSDAGRDAGVLAPDAAVDGDVALDAGIDRDARAELDAGIDRDARSELDASEPVDAAADGGRDAAVASDAGTDAAVSLDAGADGGMAGITIAFECVPAVGGNELSSGMVLSDGFWTGFRFQVGAGADVTATEIALNVRSSGAGTVFGAIVRLSGPSDAPDAPDLSGSDVIAVTTIALPGGPTSVTAGSPIAATLAPGWYAAVFGTGAFGATLASGATVHSNSGAGGCGSGFGFPFTIRQSDGMLILQAATPHFIVTGLRP